MAKGSLQVMAIDHGYSESGVGTNHIILGFRTLTLQDGFEYGGRVFYGITPEDIFCLYSFYFEIGRL